MARPVILENYFGDDAPVTGIPCAWMWRILESEILCDPFAWEPWRYVHRFLDISGFSLKDDELHCPSSADLREANLAFDGNRFAIGGIEDENFLFDRRLYKFYPISTKFRTLLEELKANKSAIATISTVVRTKLVGLKVLIADDHVYKIPQNPFNVQLNRLP